jgi:hypothetical protein
MKNRIFLFLTSLLLFVPVIFAQETAVSFLLVEPTASANGMAGSYTALANDGNAMYYNPAGLGRMQYGSLEYGFYNYYPHLKILNEIRIHYYAATAYLPSLGAFGINFTYFALSKNIITDENGNIIRTFYPNEWAFSFGYARYLNPNMALGAALKLIKTNLGPGLSIGSEKYRNNTAFALDLGFLYENFLPKLNFSKRYLKNNLIKWCIHRPPTGPSVGIAIRNIGPAMDYGDRSMPLPQQLRIGLAWNTIDTDVLSLILSTDLRKMLVHDHDDFLSSFITSWEKFSFNQLEASYGLELSLFTIISFRYGKFMENKYFGADYATYGISLGPETCQINWYVKRYDHEPLYRSDNNYWRIGFSVAY